MSSLYKFNDIPASFCACSSYMRTQNLSFAWSHPLTSSPLLHHHFPFTVLADYKYTHHSFLQRNPSYLSAFHTVSQFSKSFLSLIAALGANVNLKWKLNSNAVSKKIRDTKASQSSGTGYSTATAMIYCNRNTVARFIVRKNKGKYVCKGRTWYDVQCVSNTELVRDYCSGSLNRREIRQGFRKLFNPPSQIRWRK